MLTAGCCFCDGLGGSTLRIRGADDGAVGVGRGGIAGGVDFERESCFSCNVVAASVS